MKLILNARKHGSWTLFFALTIKIYIVAMNTRFGIIAHQGLGWC